MAEVSALIDPPPLRPCAGLALEQRRGHGNAAVDERGVARDQVQRRHRDPVTEAGRHHGGLGPLPGRDGPAALRRLQRHPLEHAERFEEGPLALRAHVRRHSRRTDIGGVNEDLRHRQPAVLRVVVANAMAPDSERLGGVVAVLHTGDAQVEGIGYGEGLEGRAKLVGAQGGAVEESVLPAPVRRLGVERGEADQSQKLAAFDVHDDPGGAHRTMGGHGVFQRFGEDVLDPDVQRECERAAMILGRPAHILADRPLDTGQPAIVHVRETDRVGEETALGIEALILTLQPETGNPEPVDGVRLLRREVVTQQRGLSCLRR